MSEALEKRMQEIRDQIAELSQARANRVYLEQFRKSKKALLMKEAQVKGAKSSAEQERDAYAHPEYQELLYGLKEATEIETRLYYEMKLSEMRFEAWRSMQANQRAEKGRYGA